MAWSIQCPVKCYGKAPISRHYRQGIPRIPVIWEYLRRTSGGIPYADDTESLCKKISRVGALQWSMEAELTVRLLIVEAAPFITRRFKHTIENRHTLAAGHYQPEAVIQEESQPYQTRGFGHVWF